MREGFLFRGRGLDLTVKCQSFDSQMQKTVSAFPEQEICEEIAEEVPEEVQPNTEEWDDTKQRKHLHKMQQHISKLLHGMKTHAKALETERKPARAKVRSNQLSV